MPDIFRTRTGQTGHTAYVAELADIMNAQRELNARADRLADVIEREAQAGVDYPLSIATDAFPDATVPAPLKHTAVWIKSRLYDEAMTALNSWPTLDTGKWHGPSRMDDETADRLAAVRMHLRDAGLSAPAKVVGVGSADVVIRAGARHRGRVRAMLLARGYNVSAVSNVTVRVHPPTAR